MCWWRSSRGPPRRAGRGSSAEDTQFTCPKCGAHEFGSSLGEANEITSRHCGGEDAGGAGDCDFSWSPRDDARYFKGTGVFHRAIGVGKK
jgi:hypothetical protein